MSDLKLAAVIEASRPGKVFYGLIAVSSIVTLVSSVMGMYSMGVTFMPALVAVLALCIACYAIYTFWNIMKAEKNIQVLNNSKSAADSYSKTA